jgi:hypothetical protein
MKAKQQNTTSEKKFNFTVKDKPSSASAILSSNSEPALNEMSGLVKGCVPMKTSIWLGCHQEQIKITSIWLYESQTAEHYVRARKIQVSLF